LEQLYDGYKLLEGDQGLVIEDSKGVPLLVVVRNVLPPNYNVSSLRCCQWALSHMWLTQCLVFQDTLTAAASEFTKKFTPRKTSKFRDEFKHPEGSPFEAMAAHFAAWWAIGHPVSFLVCLHPLLLTWESSKTLPASQPT